ncbi:MAG: glucokinase [Gammaproteobacteria bacterium]
MGRDTPPRLRVGGRPRRLRARQRGGDTDPRAADGALWPRELGAPRLRGPGIHNIYSALETPEAPDVAARIEAAEDASATITELGLARTSARCTRALDVFVSAYGAEAGNLALKALATGAVYVGGGIAPAILPKLEDGTFVRAFTAKGRFAEWLARIPVKVILDPKTALRGAAAYLAGMEVRS